MYWSSPFASLYGNLPDVFSVASRRQDDKENIANRSWTFGEHPPVKTEKKYPSSSKPATPTPFPVAPRKKVSTSLRVNQALQSDEEDEKFDYLTKRPFHTDMQSSIPDVTLVPEVEVGSNTPYYSILATASMLGDLCTPEKLPRDMHAVLELRDMRKVVFPHHGLLTASSLELHDAPSPQSPPDAFLDFVEAFSPEISPFKTFTTTKASLGFDTTQPSVFIPRLRRKDDGEEDGDGSKNYGEHEDAEKLNFDYEEDMILDEGTSMLDSPKPAVSTSLHALSPSSAFQKDETEHEDASEKEYDGEDEDAYEDDMVLESDSASISFALDSPPPAVSTLPTNNLVPRAVIPRLNPDALPFIPRHVFFLSAGSTSAPKVQVPSGVPDSHLDGVNSASKCTDESHSICTVFHPLHPAETTDADDIAFLKYFGLIDSALP